MKLVLLLPEARFWGYRDNWYDPSLRKFGFWLFAISWHTGSQESRIQYLAEMAYNKYFDSLNVEYLEFSSLPDKFQECWRAIPAESYA